MENWIGLGWIVFLPFLGFTFNILFGKKLRDGVVHTVAVGTIFASFLLSLVGFTLLRRLPEDARVISLELWNWISVGGSHGLPLLDVPVKFSLDPLSAVMILVVSGVGMLIHIYSIGYMKGDGGYYRFFAYLNLFSFAMLTLVLADNALLLFVGWEGVGLCSYLLIGFWFRHLPNTTAGNKAFIVNRIGDFGFLIGLMLLFWGLHKVGHATMSFAGINEYAHLLGNQTFLGMKLTNAIGIFFFIGAAGKSAQIPLYVWLPDAMAGPTPVSALIHAATMVTAGVYMIARLNGLYSVAPLALGVIATVGALTAIFAATIGLVQNDIKKVLAYSTVSQLGYMMLAMGVAAFSAGIFHLMTHAFFKACLFLGSGSVILSMHHEQDMRKMGGLARVMPWTFGTFLVSTIAIAGIPPFAGFFSKDEILWKTWESGHRGLWLLGLLGAMLTAFYMFRLVAMTFFGKNRADEKTRSHLREQPAVVVVPLVILALLATVGGFWGVPHALGGANQFHQWLAPVMVQHDSQHAGWEAPPLIAEARAQDAHGTAHGQAAESGHGDGQATATGHAAVDTHGNGHHGEHDGAHHVDPMEYVLMAISVLLAAVSGLSALYIYTRKPQWPTLWAARLKGLHSLLYNKYWIDEIYNAALVQNVLRLMKVLARFDLLVIDGIVNGMGWLTRGVSVLGGWFDNVFVDGLVNGVASTARAAGDRLRGLQTGLIQNYAYALVTGIVLLVIAGVIIGIPH